MEIVENLSQEVRGFYVVMQSFFHTILPPRHNFSEFFDGTGHTKAHNRSSLLQPKHIAKVFHIAFTEQYTLFLIHAVLYSIF